jgi:uncharacterized protein (TIGR03435 family)
MIPSQLLPLANHLWQSTLFAAAAGLLTLALRKNRAQNRYWLWLSASVKFLIPFSILVDTGSHFGQHIPATIPESRLSSVIEQVRQPFAVSVSYATMPAAHPSTASLIPAILCVVWAVGFVTLVCSWWQRWRRFRAALCTASPLHLPIDIEVMTSPAFREPGVFGIRQPILLLPAGITSHLAPPQLKAILAHELCHVRRHDNLATGIHMGVEALFWFHPLVWWLGARLMDERERACDEEVLRMGNEPEAYAEGILKVCELYLESPLPCVAGVTGANLKKRIEAIMANRIAHRLNFTKKVVLAATGIAALAGPIGVGLLNAPPIRAQSAAAVSPVMLGAVTSEPVRQTPPPAVKAPRVEPADPLALTEPVRKRPQVMLAQAKSAPVTQAPAPQQAPPITSDLTFEEASVRPSAPVPKEGGVYFGPPYGGPETPDPGQITWSYATLRGLLMTAYEVDAYQVSGPAWLGSERYDVGAKVPAGATKEQVTVMWRNLLADRFGVTLHHESKEFEVEELVVAKGGSKLKETAENPNAPWPPGPPKMVNGELIGPGMVHLIKPFGPNGPSAHTDAKAQPLSKLTTMMTNPFHHSVLDKTGLTGKYDFTFDWIPDLRGQPLPPPPPGQLGPASAAAAPPNLAAVVLQQLGLGLVASKVTLDVVVVDQAEKVPTGN